MTRIIAHYLSVAVTAFIFAVPLPSRAETLNCTPVTSLPAVIDTQGIHCLTGNLATNITVGTAITITANNVTLDLNGWKVGGQAAGTGTIAHGIFSTANNVTVRNGIVRGFFFGINLSGRGSVVEDMLVDQSTQIGIFVSGQGSIVRRNQVVDTGGSTAGENVQALGIDVRGPGSLVEKNLISNLTATGNSPELGIQVNFGDHILVRGNLVTDSEKPVTGTSRGIIVVSNGASAVNLLNNTVSNWQLCIFYLVGSGLFAGNTMTGCTSNFQGGTAGQQGNNFTP